MTNEELFTKTHPTRLFLTAAIPGSISMLASALYNGSEGLLIGQFLGEAAFAGASLAMPFVIINFAISDLIGVGSSVPIAIALGQGDKNRANHIFSFSVLLNIVCGAISGALLFLTAPALFHALGASGATALAAVDFLGMYALWSPITTIMYAVDNYLRICGKIRRSTFANITVAFIGLALALLFLGVFHWGVWSLPLAFSLGTAWGVAFCFYPFIRGRLPLRFVKFRVDFAVLIHIVTRGLPSFLGNISSQIASIVLNRFLLLLGGVGAVSIYGVIMYIEGFMYPLMYGMLDSLQPAVGFNWGKRNLRRVKQIELRCFGASAILSLATFVIVIVFSKQITLLFLPEADPALLKESIFALSIFSLNYCVRWFTVSCQSMWVALSQPRLAAIITICSALILPVGLLVFLLPFGTHGIWFDQPLVSAITTCLAAALLLYFRREIRRGAIIPA